VQSVRGYGGLVVSVLASGTQDRGLKENPQIKNPRHAFLPSFGSLSRVADLRHEKEPCWITWKSNRRNYSDISRSKFAPSLTEGSSDRVGSGALCRGAPTLEQHGCPLEFKGGNQSDAVHKGPV
jgi:hypothetical protein